MKSRNQWVALLATATLLLATGCETVHYELHPPRTDAGRACVTQCAAIKESCRGNELRRARMGIEACERRAESAVHLCRVDANDADKKRLCELSRPSCWVVEEAGGCEIDYRACFVRCGGSVDKIVETR